jgi:hypothetical protein
VKIKLNVPFSSEIIILAAWSIWMMRNNKIFNNQIPTFRNRVTPHFCWPKLKPCLSTLFGWIKNFC